MFPQAIGMAASFDPDLLFSVGDVISTEARAKYNESIKEGDRDIYKGLTYGRTRVVSASIPENSTFQKASTEGLTIQIQVENDSAFATQDALQIYAKNLGTGHEVLHHRLCSFQRVAFNPYEKKTIQVTIPSKAFYVVNQEGASVPEGTGAILSIGFGQPDARTEELTGTKAYSLQIS